MEPELASNLILAFNTSHNPEVLAGHVMKWVKLLPTVTSALTPC